VLTRLDGEICPARRDLQPRRGERVEETLAFAPDDTQAPARLAALLLGRAGPEVRCHFTAS
jgi:hypothetical protein